ncbi:gamma-glutamylcyclotransferase-like [Haemaphysalis longicornis]
MTSSDASKKQPDEVLYFAYGSNMWSHRMHIRNPTAKFFATGALEGYYVDFLDDCKTWQGALAALREDAKRTAHGVVWRIPKENIHILDEQEKEYKGTDVSVKLSSGEKVVCRTYFYGTSKAGKQCKPSLLYKAVIVAGALEHKLPTSYVKELVKHPDNGKKDNIGIPVDIEKLRPCVKGYIDL